MKKLKFLIMFLCLLVGIGGMLPQASAVSVIMNEDNALYFQNHEAVFDVNGYHVAPDPDRGIEEGDHFVGIINVQDISVAGETIWMQSSTDQLSGIFAQQVKLIANAPGTADPFDPSGTQLLPHLVLGPAAITTFFDPYGNSFDISPWLNPTNNEIMSLYTETGVGTTVYESNGTMIDDIEVATYVSADPSPLAQQWARFGYNGSNTPTDMTDDDGYFYSHVSIGQPLANFTGETWAGLDAIVNNTGFVFTDVNDPSEHEMNNLIANLFNDMYMSSEIEPNENSVYMGGNSPWSFLSNDPAHINPVPEPATMLLLGTGLVGLAGFARRKVKKLS